MKKLSKEIMCGVIWTFVLSAPAYASIYAGAMGIGTYDVWFDEDMGKCQISGGFVKAPAVSLNFGYVQSLNVYDDPTPKKYIDGSGLPVPLIDPPPGGYQNNTFDYLLYYDGSVFPEFCDLPSTYRVDAKTEPDNKLELFFETWLVLVLNESPGPYPSAAWDDVYTIEPMIGWKWGYDITYNTTTTDYAITKKPLEWTYDISNSWEQALDSVYGTDSDWFNVNISYTGDYYVVPEPATLALLGLGGMLLRRRRG